MEYPKITKAPTYIFLMAELVATLEAFEVYAKPSSDFQDRLKKRADELRALTMDDIDPEKIRAELSMAKTSHDSNKRKKPYE